MQEPTGSSRTAFCRGTGRDDFVTAANPAKVGSIPSAIKASQSDLRHLPAYDLTRGVCNGQAEALS